MNPLKIEQHTAKKNLFTAFTKDGNKFAGWLIASKEKGWEVKPANTWKNMVFRTKAKAVRYLIASIK